MIRAEHLTKRYGNKTAIEDVSFQVNKGEILGFLGPNGAGKTTTMRILAGFFPATEGRAEVAGFDVFEQSLEVKRRVGYLPEHPPLYDEMTVDRFLRFVAEVNGVEKSKMAERIVQTRERCGLVDEGDRLIKQLSKGFRQRVGLAQALIHDPEVLILDEPTVGLDPKQIIEVRQLIRGLGGDHTIILSTHILPEVSMTCGRVVIINNGRIVAVDTPENLTSQLRGVDRIELELAGPPEPVPALLQQLPQVVSVVAGEPRDSHHLFYVETSREQDVRHLISKQLIDSGYDLYGIRSQGMTLEEVFLELTTTEEVA